MSDHERECEHELHRLAQELGLPDDGPQENVDGALSRIRELKGANERLRTAANVGRDRIENMAQLESDYGESEELFECVAQIDACIAAAPPDSGSADEVLDE